MSGFIKLDRSILEWEWYDHYPTYRLFTHLLLRANYKPSKYRGFEIPVGALVVGGSALSDQTGLSPQQIRTALKNLEKTGEINKQSTNKFTIIIINNWLKYQGKSDDLTSKQQSINKQKTNEQQSNNNQSTTEEEGKNIYNKKPSPNGEVKKAAAPSPDLTQAMVDIWNDICGDVLKPAAGISPQRIMRLSACYQKHLNSDLNEWTKLCQRICASEFLTGGKDGRRWKASIDWILDDDNLLRTLEGHYDETFSDTRNDKRAAGGNNPHGQPSYADRLRSASRKAQEKRGMDCAGDQQDAGSGEGMGGRGSANAYGVQQGLSRLPQSHEERHANEQDFIDA